MTWGNNSVFQILIIQGSQAVTGLFLYNGLGAPGNPPQFAAVASTVTTDPFGNAITSSKILIQGNVITESGGIFRTAAAAPLIQLDGPHNALLLYNAAAALSETVASVTTSDGLGNTVQQGFTAYGSVNTTYASLIAAALQFHTSGDTASPQVSEIANAGLSLSSGQTAALAVEAIFSLNSAAAGVEPLATLSAALELVHVVATPATVANEAVLFGSGGQLRVIDGADGSNYTTERLTLVITANQTINSTTSAVVGTGSVPLSFPMSASRTYRFHAHITWVQGATQSQQPFRLIATAGLTITAMRVSVSQRTQSTTGQSVFDGDLTALNTDTANFGATGPGAGTTNTADFDGEITVNAAGTLNLEARCSNAANTYTIQAQSFAEVMPL